MRKIDFHVHVTPPEIIRDAKRIAQREPYFAMLAENPKNKFSCAEDVVRTLDAANFDSAVIFGFGFRDIGLCRLVNDYVIEKTRLYPKRLTGFLVVPPGHPEAEKEIDRAAAAGLKGAGEIFPAGQDFCIEDKAQTAGFAGACAERGLPVLIHANEPVGHYYPGKTGTTLKQLETFVENNPELTVILAHWGGGLLFYELMPEVRKKFCNVYYDTAAQIFLYDARIFAIARELGIIKKVLFGSDFPLIPPERYLKFITQELDADERRLVLGGNAEQLLSRCADNGASRAMQPQAAS
jgi:predicted TIM-barrel fold metal-dependent hydrolase